MFSEALEIFCPLMNQWFARDSCPSLQRLAFGAVLWQPVEDLKTGYQQLGNYLSSVTLDPEGSSDFLYQINRRRPSRSGIPQLSINRLSTWAVSQSGLAEVAIGQTAARCTAYPASFACQVELDINTSPGFQGEFSVEQLPQIFGELIDLGREIASQGDIP